MLDAGVDSDRPDLRVAGMINCANAESGEDDNGHRLWWPASRR